MQVILLEKVQNLGILGDQVNVKPGYARNYLIPQGKAVFATAENVEVFRARRQELEKLEKEKLEKAQARADAISGFALEVQAKAGDEGKLFGSLGTRDIADALTKAGHELNKSEVLLPEGPIRHLGEHAIACQLHSDVSVEIILRVIPEE